MLNVLQLSDDPWVQTCEDIAGSINAPKGTARAYGRQPRITGLCHWQMGYHLQMGQMGKYYSSALQARFLMAVIF